MTSKPGESPRRPPGRYASLRVSRRAGREPTRDAICAALEHLLNQGMPFPEVPVSAILKEADVSRRTFYLYFAGKHSVLAALTETYIVELRDQANDFLDRRDLTPAVRVRNTMTDTVAIYQQHATVLRAASDQWPYAPEIADTMLEAIGWLIDQTAERISQDREAGLTTTTADPHGLAAALMWAIERTLYVRSRQEFGSWETDQQLVDTLTAIWLGGIYQQAI